MTEYMYGLPTDCTRAWGARAIEEMDAGFSLVWDRQSVKGKLPRGFGAKLNKAIPFAQKAWRRLQERQPVGSGYMPAGRHVLLVRPGFRIIADTRGSCGYVHLVAELEDPKPTRRVEGDWAIFEAPDGQTHRVSLTDPRTDVEAHWLVFAARHTTQTEETA
tara:strand:+ start:74 stop:556 length:483 start_codon:yes stop_codon:yes gene_type:complete